MGGRDILVIWQHERGAVRVGIGAAGAVIGRRKLVLRGMIRFAYTILPQLDVFAQAEYRLDGVFGATPDPVLSRRQVPVVSLDAPSIQDTNSPERRSCCGTRSTSRPASSCRYSNSHRRGDACNR
jgi:hypothetical protein